MNFLVTGGAGFIGSAVIRQLVLNTKFRVLNLDKLGYASDLSSLDTVAASDRYFFKKINLTNDDQLDSIFSDFQPDILMHLAAESHVDRSIDSPSDFINNNIIGTFNLLEASRRYFFSSKKKQFLFHHVSTDEVYGDLNESDELFHEQTRYNPSSPYAASKASSDHLVRAWYRTFHLPTVVTLSSNNYGPFQFPEKLIPHMIQNALNGKKLPIYGDGQQSRDWLYVDDHARALIKVATEAQPGDTYNIGGFNEVKNIDVVRSICTLLEKLAPSKNFPSRNYEKLIDFVEDRPGHDIRYAINSSKLQQKLGWEPVESFSSGLHKTVSWYLNNPEWLKKIMGKGYQLNRLGKGD